MSGTRAITLSLNVQGAEQVKRALEQLGPAGETALRRLEDASKRAADRRQGLGLVGASANEATRALEAMGSRLGPLGAGLSSIGVAGAGAAAAVASIGVGLVATARAGDQMVASLSRLATATGDVQSAVAVYDQLYRLSLQTGVAVNDSAGSFQRFAIAAREVGGTNEQALALVATLQRAAIVAGASGQEASAAAGQLAQALASGVLQGDELRSLLENMPNLAVALARELGVGVGELRRMGSEGQLTADRVLPALVRAGEQINEEFSKIAPTMERGFQQLGVATTRFLADLDNALGLSQGIARALTGAAGAIDGARASLFPGAAAQAQGRVAAAEAAVADVARREAESRASGRRGNPAAFQRQRDAALAELERAQIAALAIEQDGDFARFNEAQAAGERRAANENRQLDAGLAALRTAYDRRTGVEETHQRAVSAIQTQVTRGAIDAAEAQRLTAAADRERADALRRLEDVAPRAAAGLRQVREADGDADWRRADALALRTAQQAFRQNEQETQRATERMEREAENSARDISRFLADGFTDAFVDGERGFAGMMESFQRLAIQTPIRIAAEAFISPLARSAAGAIGGAGGQGGIADLLGFTEAGGSIASFLNLGGGAAGGISGLLRTPIGASFGSSATLGSAIGGVGGGFALGSLIGGFTAGDSRARQQNSQFGSGAGAAAGAAIGSFLPIPGGTVIGGLLGGALGGGLGGMIGPGRAFSGGDALIGVNDNGGLNVIGFAGKNFEQSEQLLAQAQEQVAALNAVLQQAGLTFARGQGGTDPGAFAAAIGGGESGNPRDLLGALGQFGVGGLRAEDARVQGALDRLFERGGGDIQTQIAAATEAAQFAAQIDAIAQAARDAEDPIGAIKRAYEDQFATAQRLGFGYETLAAAQQKAIDAVEAQKRAEATSRAGAVQGILDDLTIGGAGGLSPDARATAARLRLQGSLGALGDGATNAEIEDLRRVAAQTLPVIQQIEGITGGFATLVQQVSDAARAAAPGADTANLGGVIDATINIGDQIADAVSFAGGATVQAVQDLKTENQRLNARLDALIARLAA
jgi:tape measure domain-containing protein